MDEEWHEVLEGEDGVEKQEEMTIFLNALEENERGATIRVLGQYNNRQLIILIENGSTTVSWMPG